jgi:CBS domain-containing protein
LQKATTIAANLGRAIGWVFIVAGVAMVFGAHVPFFGGGAGNGAWLAFIGWFLKESAQDSAGAQRVYDALHGLRVHDLMRRSATTVPADVDVRTLADGWFLRTGERAFPVMDRDRLVGVVSIVDLHKVDQAEWSHTAVTAIMTPRDRLAVVRPELDAEAALRAILEKSVHQLPVLEGGTLIGMLFGADVMRWVELHEPSVRRPLHPRVST